MKIRQLLYIDDDEDDQEIFQMAISEINDSIHCIAANDASEALKKLINAEWKPEVIFLDLNMPVMDGQEFLQEVRNRNELKHIPVIIWSTSSHPSIVQLLKDMGAYDFITKPDSYPQIVKVLESLLRD